MKEWSADPQRRDEASPAEIGGYQGAEEAFLGSEQRLQELNRTLRTLYKCNQALAKASKSTPPTLSELLGRVFGHFCRAFQ